MKPPVRASGKSSVRFRLIDESGATVKDIKETPEPSSGTFRIVKCAVESPGFENENPVNNEGFAALVLNTKFVFGTSAVGISTTPF